MSKKNIVKIKNTKKYIIKPDPNIGGDNKDFFYGDDQSFAQHKANLISKTSIISQEIKNRSDKNFATLKVSLKEDAIAKTHRPTTSLFNHKYPVIGGGDIGEIYVQVNERSLPSLAERLSQAKVKSEVKFGKNGELISKVGNLRSEVSAIEDIDLYRGMDKCTLSDIEISRELIENKRDIIVELFTPQENETLKNDDIKKLKDEFINKLQDKYSSFDVINESKFFLDNIITLSIKKINSAEVLDLINDLRCSPIVRKYYPTPIISVAKNEKQPSNKIKEFPQKETGKIYPKVILVDKGIRSNILSNWVTDKSDALGDEVIYEFHADEMASILIGSKYLNEDVPFLEDDGCEIYDIWLPSDKYSFDDHFDSLSEFTDWLYLEIQTARENGFKIISMSINFQQMASDNEYSFIASRIDEISLKFDVVFIISVGNLEEKKYRNEWPKNESQVFKMLARFQHQDKLFLPADSVTSISVGAVNHINNRLITYQAPTRYTRRGPATAYGIKPDLVHMGGIGDSKNSCISTLDGLNRLNNTSHGTSLAAPHVAKIIATVDQKSNESMATNTLKALMLHNADIPDCLASKSLSREAKDFVGFGFPKTSSNIISKDESSFTFIFEDVLKKGQVAEFLFFWPKSLITPTGKCKGKVRMTLVYSPPIDRRYGQEYIRANVDASLQQENIKGGESKFSKAVHSIWDIRLGESNSYEKGLIEHGFKWWPSKVYERTSKNGFGNSFNWRLRISSQVRDGVIYPLDGINFSVIITIEDQTRKATNIYNEMRQGLLSLGIDFQDITIRDEVRV